MVHDATAAGTGSHVLAAVLMLLASSLVMAETQPRIWVVDREHPQAADDNPGTDTAPLLTINQAATLAHPGDTVLVHQGTYRERVTPARGGTEHAPIIYRAADDEHVIVTGLEPWSPNWRKDNQHAHVYLGDLDLSWFDGIQNPYHTRQRLSLNNNKRREGFPPFDDVTARPAKGPKFLKTLGMVFLDDKPLDEKASLEQVRQTPGSWFVMPDGKSLAVHFPDSSAPPKPGRLEIAVRDRIFSPRRRGLEHIHVIGFDFFGCANQGAYPQIGMVDTRSGKHWRIAHNTVRYAKTLGIVCGSETWQPAILTDTDEDQRRMMIGGYHVIEYNTVTDHGTVGITAWHSMHTVVRGNVVARNNRLRFVVGDNAETEEDGGIKMLTSKGIIVENNLVYDNHTHGIWLDNGWAGGRVTGNVSLRNTQHGIFIEIGMPATNEPLMVTDNIAALNHQNGIYSHDASNVIFARNLVFKNRGFGFKHQLIPKRRHGKALDHQPTQASDLLLVGNLVIGNGQGAISMPLAHDRVRNSGSDHNLFFANASERAIGRPLYKGTSDRSASAFQINRSYNMIAAKDVIAAYRKALKRAGVPESKWPKFQQWSKTSMLSLGGWQAVMDNDRHSEVPEQVGIRLIEDGPKWVLETYFKMNDDQANVWPELPGSFRHIEFPDSPLRKLLDTLKLGEQQRLVIWPLDQTTNVE